MKPLADTDPMPFGKYGPAGMKFTAHADGSAVADTVRRDVGKES
jgi:hypothetical protein